MTRFGYFLSCEEHGPRELLRQAKMAEDSGFEGLWISDHFHPWIDEQGESSFVWSVIGALSQVTTLPVTTAVTCPIQRIHPAIVAQAAATSQVLLDGRFRLGLGTGEALNEHITGAFWPSASERREMLEEAIEIIRDLFTGKLVTHHGEHYTVDTARLYTLPDTPPPIHISGFGEAATQLAARIGDGYMSTMPDAEMRELFHASGGAGKPATGALKVCWAPDAEQARKTVLRLWPNEQMEGEAAQVLPLPRHFEQLAGLITEDMVELPCGPDPEVHAKAIRAYADAGFDEVYIAQIGPDQERFFDFFEREVRPLI